MADDMIQALYGQGGSPSPLSTAPPPRLEDVLRQHYQNAGAAQQLKSPQNPWAIPDPSFGISRLGQVGADLVGGAKDVVSDIAKRAFGSSEALRTGDKGGYDPAPILEASTLPLGGGLSAPAKLGAESIAANAPRNMLTGGISTLAGSEAYGASNKQHKQDMETQAAAAAQAQAAEIARIKASNEADIAKQQAIAKLQADQAAQAKAQQDAAPFAQRYPEAAKGMALGGLALSVATPYGSRMWGLRNYNRQAGSMADQAAKTEAAYLAGNTAQGKLLGSTLPDMKQRALDLENKIKPGFLGTVAGFEAPSIGTNIPNLLDYVGGTSEQKAQAQESAGDWKRIIGSQISGLGGGVVGAKFPLPFSKAPMPGIPKATPSIVKALKAEGKK